MSVDNIERELQCVSHWFSSWSPLQKQDFLKDLLDKLFPVHVDSLFASMHQMSVTDKAPSIFQCQLKLFSDWFSLWTDKQRNDFILRLAVIDSDFVKKFNEEADKVVQQQGLS